MAQHTYDEESVQELLGWAKKMLETKSYPTEKYQVNACTSIIDGKLYLESLISMISSARQPQTLSASRAASRLRLEEHMVRAEEEKGRLGRMWSVLGVSAGVLAVVLLY